MSIVKRGSQIPTLKAKYIPYKYMNPLGLILICSAQQQYIHKCLVLADTCFRRPGSG